MKKLFTSTIFIISIFLLAAPASASIIWGTDASGELIGSRDSNGGITATDGWAGGNFELSWIVEEDNGLWTYIYTVNTEDPLDPEKTKDISHFILEVTEDGNPFNIFGDTDAFEGPKTWTEASGNPEMPNDIYGIKFDFGGSPATYTIIIDRAPVYGVFYAKDGRDDGDEVVAWSNALNSPTYRTDSGFTTTDFIVRPDSVGVVPVPGAVWLLGSGLIGLAGIRKKFKS